MSKKYAKRGSYKEAKSIQAKKIADEARRVAENEIAGEILSVETAEKVVRTDCPYCVRHLKTAKKVGGNVIWNRTTNDILGITFDGGEGGEI